MLKLQAYKFQLRTKPVHEAQMRRFVWNRALALEQEASAETKKRLGYGKIANMLPEWKKSDECLFLSEAPSQVLQQTLKGSRQGLQEFLCQAI